MYKVMFEDSPLIKVLLTVSHIYIPFRPHVLLTRQAAAVAVSSMTQSSGYVHGVQLLQSADQLTSNLDTCALMRAAARQTRAGLE